MSSNSEAPAKPGSQRTELKKIGKYELEKQLGVGGMGTVYLAKDTQLKRLVALKVLPSDKAENPTLVRRFQAEAQAAAQLRHENIVAVYDSGEADGCLYIAMEYVDGYDLQELIRKRGKLPVKRTIEIVKQVAKALQHAAVHRIIHRDIKPSNLLIRNDGVMKLVDLGLARSIDDTLETNITRAGTTVGTVDYMSPEQARSSKMADTRSDLYSLGCTWYHMLTGQPPYPVGSMTNKLNAHATSALPNPIDLNELVSEGLVAVLHRMMAKRPEDRYQTPEELIADLDKPSLTRGGAVSEMISEVVAEEVKPRRSQNKTKTESGPNAVIPEKSAVPEEAKNETAPGRVRRKAAVETAPEASVLEPSGEETSPSRTRRSGPMGWLPPKKQPQKADTDAEEKDSVLNWETLQPFVLGAGILVAIACIGLLVAALSGNLNSDPLHVGKANSAASSESATAPQTVMNAAAGPAATPTQGSAATGDTGQRVVTSPDGDAVATGAAAAASGSAVITNDNDGEAGDSTAAAASAKEAPPVLRSFDSEATPGWAASPAGSAGAGSSPGPGDFSGSTAGPAAATGALQVVGAKSAEKNRQTPFVDLTDALRAVPATGGTLQLTGAGPFRLPLIRLERIAHLKLTSAGPTRPVIMLTPSSGSPSAGLSLSNGVLELEGLHLMADRALFQGSEPVRMIEVLDGQLKVKECAFSVWGTGQAPVTALHVGSQDEFHGTQSRLEPRVLLDRVFIRGDELTAFAIARPTADVVIQNSLLVSGSGPVLSISGSLPGKLAGAAPAKVHRALRFRQSTLFGKRDLVRASADGAPLPPSTSIVIQDSICATAEGAADSCLLDAVAWPLPEGASSLGRKPVNFDWIMKDSLALGFQRLAKFDGGTILSASDVKAWEALWTKSAASGQYVSTAWPGAPDDLAGSLPAAFDVSRLSAAIAALPNAPAATGCSVEQLVDPAQTVSRGRLEALLAKPAFPEFPQPDPAAQIVRIDVTKKDLGQELKNGNWPPGTVIEVSGSGLKPITPVKLVGKSWRIVGRPQEAGTLTFTPKSGGSDATALFAVQGGSLVLENLRFEVKPTQNVSVTSLIAGEAASLALKDISVHGSLASERRLECLVRWNGDDLDGHMEPPTLLCTDSYFIGNGSLLRIDAGPGSVFLKNSLFVARGDVLDIHFRTLRSGAAMGAVLAEHVTFSATRSAIHLQGSGASAATLPLRLYIEDNVFAPALPFKDHPGGPTVFSLADFQNDRQRIEWWGLSNGVAQEVASLLRDDDEQSPNYELNGLPAWHKAFPGDQDLRFLTDPHGVELDDPLPNKTTGLKPSQFSLSPNCTAARWTETGQPIGADLRHLDPLGPVEKTKDASKATKTAPTTVPDF